MTASAIRIGVTAALLPLLLAAPGCGEKKTGTGEAQRPVVTGVKTVAVREAIRPVVIEAVGSVRAKTIAAISPQIMGRLTAVRAAEGSRVAAGDLLAEIDDEGYRAQAAAAEAALAEATAAREEAARAIAQAEAAMVLAGKTYERHKALLAEKVVTHQEFDEVEARRTLAVKEHERAIARRAQVEARVALAKAQFDGARTSLSHARVRAPFAGVVTSKLAEAGATAVAGQPLFVLEDTSLYRIEAAVPETHLALLKPGYPLEAVLAAAPGTVVRTRVAEVVTLVDPATRTFTVKADLKGPNLRSGQFGRIRFSAGTMTVVAVPEGAVVRAGGYDGIFVVGPDNTARFTVIKTGDAVDGQVAVLSGLSPGARVAVAPVDRLVDGARVETVP